ncbi:MAG: RNA polymerase sigma factor, partial [Deltaproteobacteria bacterium]
LLQETWLRMIRNLDRFDPRYTFSSWLFQIALNLCRDFARARSVRQRAAPLLCAEAEGKASVETPEGKVIAEERRATLQSILDRLPPRQREVVLLRCLYGYSESEVARIVRSPKGTVKSRLHHAIRKLKSLLEKFHGEERRYLRNG